MVFIPRVRDTFQNKSFNTGRRKLYPYLETATYFGRGRPSLGN
jgi:hypothetical protein